MVLSRNALTLPIPPLFYRRSAISSNMSAHLGVSKVLSLAGLLLTTISHTIDGHLQPASQTDYVNIGAFRGVCPLKRVQTASGMSHAFSVGYMNLSVGLGSSRGEARAWQIVRTRTNSSQGKRR